jgi:hypothetical protein
MNTTRETLHNNRWYHVEQHTRDFGQGENWQYAVWGLFLLAMTALVLGLGL